MTAEKKHKLKEVLNFLEGQGGSRQQALKTLRAYLYRDPPYGSNRDNPVERVLVNAFANCLRPAFAGDPEKLKLLDHLMQAPQKRRANTKLETILGDLRTISSWLRESINLDPLSLPSVKLLNDLLEAMTLLGRGNRDLEQRIEGLRNLLSSGEPAPETPRGAQPGGQATEDVTPPRLDTHFWDDLDTLCQDAIRFERSRHKARQRERSLMMEIVTELATQLTEIHSSTDGIDDRVSQTVNRLHGSRDINDLKQLRDVLLQEAEGLKLHTHSLHQQLERSQMQLKVAQDAMEELSRELDRSRTESLTDALTKVPNRRALSDRLDSEVERAQRYGLDLTLAFFDLDHFKKINDTYGHAVGDKVLIAVAERAKLLLRQSDFLGRYGGEEFALILPETTLADAVQVADKIRTEISALRFRTHGQQLKVTASFGVSCLTPDMDNQEKGKSGDTGCEVASCLLEQADVALYTAKNAGRNRVVPWRRNMMDP